ncbi:MAG: hypothetical protein JOZ81_34385 [Chloroflexi bacterium]|nr:hypothetical protein [Chloroflexota bacterium]
MDLSDVNGDEVGTVDQVYDVSGGGDRRGPTGRRARPTDPGARPLHTASAVATSPLVIALLGRLALLAQALDLLSSLRMVLEHGINAELNPLLRVILVSAGPVGVAIVKLGLAAFVVSVLQHLAYVGRPRLARNSLLIAVNVGVIGALSNGCLKTFAPF